MFLLLIGCNQSESTSSSLSEVNLCAVKVDDEQHKICYGMNKSEVENILGKGQLGDLNQFQYGQGIRISFRDNRISGITLDEQSKGYFRTSHGAEVGMPKSEIKKRYGEENAVELGIFNLDYFYHTRENTFMSEIIGMNRDEAAEVLIFSALFNEQGDSTLIMMMDGKRAMFFE